MDLPEEHDRVWLLLRGRAWFMVAYRVSEVGNAHPELEFYWGTSAFGEKGSVLAKHFHDISLECYKLARNGIIEPKSSSQTSVSGRRYWGFIVATGPSRKAATVFAGMLPAKDRAEVEASIAEIQRIMGATEADVRDVSEQRTDGDSCLIFSADSIKLQEPPIDPPGTGKPPAWVTSSDEDASPRGKQDVDAADEMFERLKDFLWKPRLGFCVVYRVCSDDSSCKMNWFKILSPYTNSDEEYDRLADLYRGVAISSWKNGRNMVLEENFLSQDSSGKQWWGPVFPAEVTKNPPLTDYYGRPWCHLAVGAGATRDAGYVVVARITAKNEKDAHQCIVGIEEIMSKRGS